MKTYLPHQEYIQKYIDYDPIQGTLFYKPRDVSEFRDNKPSDWCYNHDKLECNTAEWICKAYNKRWAGKPVFSNPNRRCKPGTTPTITVGSNNYSVLRVLHKYVTGLDIENDFYFIDGDNYNHKFSNIGLCDLPPEVMPSVEYLRECFDYDPIEGIFKWKVRPREHFDTDEEHYSFNLNKAGKLVKDGFNYLRSKDWSKRRDWSRGHFRLYGKGFGAKGIPLICTRVMHKLITGKETSFHIYINCAIEHPPAGIWKLKACDISLNLEGRLYWGNDSHKFNTFIT